MNALTNKLLLALMLTLGASICMTGCNGDPMQDRKDTATADKAKQDGKDIKPVAPRLFAEVSHTSAKPSPQERSIVGRFRMSCPPNQYVLDFAPNHKMFVNCEDMGQWKEEGDNIVITYNNKLFGTATLAFQNDNKLVGPNKHANGQVFNWLVERMPPYANKDKLIAGRFLMTFTGADHGSTSWKFTEDHKAIESGEEMGQWSIEDDNIVITYTNTDVGNVTLAFQNDNKLVGLNRHANGKVFNRVMERMPSPPDVKQDIIDLIDQKLVEVNVIDQRKMVSMNLPPFVSDCRPRPQLPTPPFLVEITLQKDKKVIQPFVIPAGVVFRPYNDNCQNIMVMKAEHFDNLIEKRRVSLIVCGATPGRSFEPFKYKQPERLPEDSKIRQLCVELSFSPLPWKECQDRVWNVAKQNPLTFK